MTLVTTLEDSAALIGGVLGAISVVLIIGIVLLMVFIIWYNRKMAKKTLWVLININNYLLTLTLCSLAEAEDINQRKINYYTYLTMYTYIIIIIMLSLVILIPAASKNLSVQSSFKLNLPPHLIVHSSNIKITQTVGQGTLTIAKSGTLVINLLHTNQSSCLWHFRRIWCRV